MIAKVMSHGLNIFLNLMNYIKQNPQNTLFCTLQRHWCSSLSIFLKAGGYLHRKDQKTVYELTTLHLEELFRDNLLLKLSYLDDMII